MSDVAVVLDDENFILDLTNFEFHGIDFAGEHVR